MQTGRSPTTRELFECGYKNLLLLNPPSCLFEFAFWLSVGQKTLHCNSFSRDRQQQRGLCPREAAGGVCLTSSSFWLWLKLAVENHNIYMFPQTGSSVSGSHASGGGKPGAHQARTLERGKKELEEVQKRATRIS